MIPFDPAPCPGAGAVAIATPPCLTSVSVISKSLVVSVPSFLLWITTLAPVSINAVDITLAFASSPLLAVAETVTKLFAANRGPTRTALGIGDFAFQPPLAVVEGIVTVYKSVSVDSSLTK